MVTFVTVDITCTRTEAVSECAAHVKSNFLIDLWLLRVVSSVVIRKDLRQVLEAWHTRVTLSIGNHMRPSTIKD